MATLAATRATATVLAAVLVATPAFAEPQPSAQDRQAAGDLVKKAIAKSQTGDHQTAIETYLQAYTLIPQPLLLSNIGSEYQQAGKPTEALKYFCMYLDKDPAGALAPFATTQAKALQIQLGNKGVDDRSVCAPVAGASANASTSDGGVTGTKDLVTREGTTSESGGGGLRVAGVAVGAVGLVGLGVSAYYVHRSMVLNDAVENSGRIPYDDNVLDEQDEGPRANTRAWIFGVSGAALVTGGVVMYFIGRSKKHAAEHVTIAPTRDGFAIAGAF